MKSFFLTTLLGLFMNFLAYSQVSDVLLIEQTVTAFAKAADVNDATELEKHLDPNFRIVMNRLFGSSEVSVLPRSVYLEKIESKEFGGDDRKLTIQNIVMNGLTAQVQVTLLGTKMTIASLLTLVKNEKGIWQLVSDVPSIQ